MARSSTLLHPDCPASALCPEQNPSAHLLFHERQFEECAELHRETLEKCPACPSALFPLISCLGPSGRFEEADLLVERLLPAANGDIQLSDLCRLKGRILRECLGPKEAIQWLELAAELDPDSAALSQLADAAWRLRRKATAARLSDQALKRAPYDPVIIRRSVGILVRAGRNETAKRHLLQLAKRDYDIPQYYAVIAEGLIAVGLTRKGLALARRIAKSHPESGEVACTASGLLMEAGKWDEAEPLLRRLQKLDPAGHGKYALMNLALISAGRQDFEKLLLHVIEAQRNHDDDDTRKLLKTAVRTVTAGVRARDTELERAKSEIERVSQEHETLKRSLAGYDTTEHGAVLEFALNEGEGWHIEFMERMPEQVRDLAKEMAALSSQSDGGTIFIGVRDGGPVVGVDAVATLKERDEWRHRIAQIATKTVSPSNAVTVYFNQHGGLDLVRIWVPEGAAPIYYVDDIPYIRNLDESRKATPEEVEEYVARRSKR